MVLCLDVKIALLASSLLQSLWLLNVVEAIPKRILHLLLLHLNFGVEALLVKRLNYCVHLLVYKLSLP